jgi:glycosyltransferase involved in cell wall biosynthesis
VPQDNNATDSIWCVIPVYNNSATVRDVVVGCRAILKNVLVVDDGSTDADVTSLLSGLDAVVLKHDKNQGKGRAILTAAEYIDFHGGEHMITIDGDGQHHPEDIKKFLPLIKEDEASIIVGSRNFDTENVPGKSRFGRKFANFWLRIETGVYIDDCQSGFRAYPVKYLRQMKLSGSHYDFEAEVLAKAVWAGLSLRTVSIDVYYPKPEERVSSFRPLLDNMRLTHTHGMLFGRRLLPFPHKRLVSARKSDELTLLRRPGKFIKMLLLESATPGGLASAAAVGIFLGVLPIFFFHSIAILYVATRLKLNKVVAFNAQHICMPPFVPALCIEVGFFLRWGHWLSDISFETIFKQFSDRLMEWFLGSLIVAPLAAMLAGGTVYLIASIFRKTTTAAEGNEQ